MADGAPAGPPDLGTEAPIRHRRELVNRRLSRPGVRKDLTELTDLYGKADAFWGLYMGPAERFKDYLAGSRVVTDAFPWIEYPYFRSKRDGYYDAPSIFKWPPPAEIP